MFRRISAARKKAEARAHEAGHFARNYLRVRRENLRGRPAGGPVGRHAKWTMRTMSAHSSEFARTMKMSVFRLLQRSER
jgi:hypothetical protein